MGSLVLPKMMLVLMVLAIAGRGYSGKCCKKIRKQIEKEFEGVHLELQNLTKRVGELEKEPPKPMGSDCSDIHKADSSLPSGIYTIQLQEGKEIPVYCDMTTDGGGWLVFQRRQDGSENFYRGWADYTNGFGKLDGEFWLGNDLIAAITKKKSYELRVDLEDFENNKRYAKYNRFSIDGHDSFKLSLGSYSGTAGDDLSYHNGMKFSTSERDNDQGSSENCAERYKGAWWYKHCHRCNLNGQYLRGNHASYADGVNWYSFKGHNYSLKFTEMKLRPV